MSLTTDTRTIHALRAYEHRPCLIFDFLIFYADSLFRSTKVLFVTLSEPPISQPLSMAQSNPAFSSALLSKNGRRVAEEAS